MAASGRLFLKHLVRVMQNSPMKMIKKLSDLRRHAADGAASEGFA